MSVTDLMPALQRLMTAADEAGRTQALGDWTVDLRERDATHHDVVIANPEDDLGLEIGKWTLRLFPQSATPGGGTEFTIELTLDPATGLATELRTTLARFELEADPAVLIAADLRTEPWTHLVRSAAPGGDPIPVRLLGPGLTLVLSGAGLGDLRVEPSGAAGSASPTFPSLRFDPPHFLIGDDAIGVVCDEAVLDLSVADNPQAVDDLVTTDATWRGLFLRDLGIFVNNEGAADTWSGMASVSDFAIGFDGLDLTGTFTAELVHHVVDDPQVALARFFRADDGEKTEVPDSGDVPAPTAGLDYRLVNLVAQPSWDDPDGLRAAGAVVRWTVPDACTVIEPLRLTMMDLGWVQAPPGIHAFTVTVEDHRIAPVTATVELRVGATGAGGAPTAFTATVEAGVVDPDATTSVPPGQRLHVPVPHGAQVRIATSATRGGSGTATAVLTALPAGWSVTSGAASQQLVRPPGENAYPSATWVVTAPASGAADGAFEVTLTDSAGAMVRRRIRWTLGPPSDPLTPDLALTPYVDWLAEPGPAIARVGRTGGLAFSSIAWTLESLPATDALLGDAASDGLFTADNAPWAPATGQTLRLTDSAGTVRPHLHTDDRLWRLSGTVAAAPATTPPPYVVGTSDATRIAAVVRAVGTGGATTGTPYPGTVAPILFAYDSQAVAGSRPGGDRTGPEASPRPLDDVLADQARGLARLLDALHELGSSVASVVLVGAASVEGNEAYNLDLGLRRATALRDALLAVLHGTTPSALATRLTAAGYSEPADLDARTAHLTAATVHAVSIGESAGAGTPAAPAPADRRVDAVLLIAPTPPPGAVVRRAYFLTLPGAPPPTGMVPVPQRALQQHPFHHSVFRMVHVEVELQRNRLVRAQLRVTLDLEAFNENDVLADDELNVDDGVMTFVFEYVETTDPVTGQRAYAWDGAALADPDDRDGLAVIQDDPLRGILGGPGIVLPAVTALAGGRVGLSAAIAAVVAGELLVAIGAINVERIIWTGARARVAYGDGVAPELRFALDYTVKYLIDVDLSEWGFPATLHSDEPITITFRNLGIVIRDWQHVEFTYEPDEGFALEVNDPGVFTLGEGVGRLLSVNSLRSGAGSPLWLEVELGFAFDTGIFNIDAIRIRLSLELDKLFTAEGDAVSLGAGLQLEDIDFAINKIGVSGSIPGVLEGSGAAGIRQTTLQPSGITGTEVTGEVDISLIPLGLRLYAGLKVFSSPELTALFASLGGGFVPGIPLGNTGVALFGLEGLVGVNMRRSEEDPTAVLDWYLAPTEGVTDPDKWTPEPGAWAIGAGAVFGTAEGGFLWSTKGGLIIQAPGPQILLSTASKFIAPRFIGTEPLSGGLVTILLLDFEHDLLLAQMQLTLDVPNIIEIAVPGEAFFNLADVRDWHLRLGQWEPERKRVRARVLGLFDAWANVQIEGNGFQGPGIDLHGLSIAHGAGTSIVFGSQGAKVWAEASLEYHVGLELRAADDPPFYLEGNLNARGELHLGPFSLGVTVHLDAKAPDPFVLNGEACAEIELLFFTLKGCVGFSIGDGHSPTPPPHHPLRELRAIDRMTSAAIDPGGRVPLDAALHLVFDQIAKDARPSGRALDLGGGTRRNQISSDLFYEFDVTELTIMNTATGVAVTGFASAWAPPSLTDATAEQADGPATLRLLDWAPTAHRRALDFAAGYGATLEALVERLCEPVPPPVRGCATFDEEPLGAGVTWTLDEGGIVPVWVLAAGGEPLASGTTGVMGGAAVVALPGVVYDGRTPTAHALRLAAAAPGSRDGGLAAVFPAIVGKAPPAEQPKIFGDVKGEGTGVPLLDPALRARPKRKPDLRDPLGVAGVVLIRLPDLVEADAIVVIAKRALGGEALFCDAALRPVGPVQPLGGAPLAAGSAPVAAEWSGYEARRVSFDGRAEKADAAVRAGWLVLLAPDPPPGLGDKPGTPELPAFLDEVCGTTFGAWADALRQADERATAQAELVHLSGVLAGSLATPSSTLLARDTQYRVQGTIAWRRYRDATAAGDDGTGTLTLDETFRTMNTPPADVRPYVAWIEPATLGQPHYRAEPVEIGFAADTVDAIFGAFGQQLVARLKPDTGGGSLVQPLRAATEERFVPIDSFAEHMTAAIDGAACIDIDGASLFPVPVFTTAGQVLAPNTGYTLSLIPRPSSEPPTAIPPLPAGRPRPLSVAQWWDGELQRDFDADKAVLRSDLRSSRWLSFADHLTAYRAGHVLDLLAGPTADLIAALAAVTVDRADESVDALCVALAGGPIAIPKAPQVLRVWTVAGEPPGPFAPPPFAFAGLLLDGPEPLLRLRPDGSAAVTVSAAAGATAWPARVVCGASGARVLALAPALGAPTGPLTVTFEYRRAATDAATAETLTIPLPTTPGPAE